MSFRALLLTGEQIRAGRAFLRLEQAQLAQAAGVSLETIKRLERMRGPVEANTRTVAALASAFHERGIVFDLNLGAGPGLRFTTPEAALAGLAGGAARHRPIRKKARERQTPRAFSYLELGADVDGEAQALLNARGAGDRLGGFQLEHALGIPGRADTSADGRYVGRRRGADA